VWVTAGERALSLGNAVDLCLGFGREVGMGGRGGMGLEAPPVAPPGSVPAFLDLLPPTVGDTAVSVLDSLTVYLSGGSRFPSSLGLLSRLGMQRMPDPGESLAASLRYWAETTGQARSRSQGAVA